MNPRRAPRQQKDAAGFRLCRVPACGKRVGRGLRSYCSPACREAFAVAYFPAETRRAVFERDKGVCAKCGVDTEWVKRIGYRIRLLPMGGFGPLSGAAVARRVFFADVGFFFPLDIGSLWEADHVVPCARGGWGRGLDNFQTLCLRCHRIESARLAGELAAERRANAERRTA